MLESGGKDRTESASGPRGEGKGGEEREIKKIRIHQKRKRQSFFPPLPTLISSPPTNQPSSHPAIQPSSQESQSSKNLQTL